MEETLKKTREKEAAAVVSREPRRARRWAFFFAPKEKTPKQFPRKYDVRSPLKTSGFPQVFAQYLFVDKNIIELFRIL